MSVDYEEGRRLDQARKDARKKWSDDLSNQALIEIGRAERAFDEWLHANAEALLNPDPWRPIEELPEKWKDGRRLLLAFWLHNKPDTEYCVVAASWIDGEGWMIDEETQWYPYPPTHFRELKGPGQ